MSGILKKSFLLQYLSTGKKLARRAWYTTDIGTEVGAVNSSWKTMPQGEDLLADSEGGSYHCDLFELLVFACLDGLFS